jgi:hypothetical protein
LWLGWGKYQAWKAEQERLKTLDQDTIELILETPIFTRYGAPEQPRDGAQSAP